MESADVVRKRRMVRHFTPEPVPVETVERIVRTAQHAPSAGFSQGISCVLVTDPETRRQVGRDSGDEEYAEGGFHPFVSEAPVQIVVCTSKHIATATASRTVAVRRDRGRPLRLAL